MLSTGTKLGPYEIAALIGSGGMGEVYRARDSRLGRDVAVKVIRGAGAHDPARLQRFELEARAASLLNHPNVLGIHDIGSHEGAPYLVSELLEGETVRLRLVSGPIQPSKVLGFAMQIADGLAAAHEKGIVHRDLKPENLFITKDDRVKILDFGLAKLLQVDGAFGVDSQAPTAETSGPTVGTVSYMSPEQIRGRLVDHRSDIFSFGVVLYEMLTGRRAFQAASAVETMNAALKEDPPELDKLPAGLDLIVQHCIEKDPAHRFQSAPDLAFHLKALSTASVTGKRAPLVPARGRIFTLKRVAAGVAAAALLAGSLELGRRLGRTSAPSFHQLTFRRGLVLSARFAPDGQTIVYGAAWDGLPFQVFSTRPESPESRSLGLPAADVLAVSSSGELALSLGQRFTLGHETEGVLARVPFSGGAPREILAGVAAADWAPDGRTLAAIHVVAGRYLLEFPLGTVIYESPGWLSHVRVSHRGNRLAFIEHPVRADDRGDICVIDRDSRGRRTLAAGWASANGLAWRDDDDEVWFTAAAAGGRTSLSAADLSGKQRLISEAPGRLALADLKGNRALLTDSRLRVRLAVRTVSDRLETERDLSWLDGSVNVDLSDDGRRLLFSEQGTGAAAQSYAAYLRTTDGAPAVRLGEGLAQSLSPDGSLAATITLGGRGVVMLLPTGPGENRSLPPGKLTHIDSVAWFPEGSRLVLTGNEAGRPTRLYIQEVKGGDPRPISPEGLRVPYPTKAVSPDGRSVAAVDRGGRLVIVSSDGGAVRHVGPAEPLYAPIRWASDGRSLYVFTRGELPARISRLDVDTGSSTSVAEVAPLDRAGVRPPIAIQITPDGKLCTYSYSQTLADLYLAQVPR